MENVALKPGNQSTEFMGKLILQIIVIVNLILNAFKFPAFDVSPEVSLSIAGGIEGVWMIFRQWNKRLELTSKTALAVAEKGLTLESIKSNSQLELMKLQKEPTELDISLANLSKAVGGVGKKGGKSNAES